jgi:predicted amidohydrolase YtcJ
VTYADTTVYVGRIRTMTAVGAPPQRAVAVRQGRIVGVSDDPNALTTPTASVVELGDRVMLPGFVDPHAHVELCSVAADMVDCRVPTVSTIDDLLDALRDGMRSTRGTCGWVLGQANLFFDKKLGNRRYPTRAELDSVSREVPIAIRAGGHSSLMNQRALELIRADHLEDGAQGGMGAIAVGRREHDGTLSSLISEADNHIPHLYAGDEAFIKDSVRRGVRDLWTRFGVTTICEMSESLGGLRSIDELQRAGQLTARIVAYVMAPTTLPFADVVQWHRSLQLESDPDQFTVRGIKMFCDGGYSARNAATRQPFVDEYANALHPCGQINMTRLQIIQALTAAVARGEQLAVHTNGERAQIELAEAIIEAGLNGQHAVRAEHAGNLITDWTTVDAWRSAQLVPVPQPQFLYNFGAYIPDVLGADVDAGQFRFRSLLDAGYRLSGSSDLCIGAEIDQSNPMMGIWCSTERIGYRGDPVGRRDERVTRDEAFMMHTLYAAETLGVADTRGSIESGKLADLVVLDRDPYSDSVLDVRDVLVDHVLLGGRSVHHRAGSAPLTEVLQ